MAELPKIDLKYLKEAFKEPINFWGMAGFAVAAAYVQDVTPLVAALATEALYLATVPASNVYRRLVDRREKQRLNKLREQQREAQIKLFDPREREAGWIRSAKKHRSRYTFGHRYQSWTSEDRSTASSTSRCSG